MYLSYSPHDVSPRMCVYNRVKRIRVYSNRNRSKLDRFSLRRIYGSLDSENDRGNIWALGEARENSSRKLEERAKVRAERNGSVGFSRARTSVEERSPRSA